jgi:hypothetical protein
MLLTIDMKLFGDVADTVFWLVSLANIVSEKPFLKENFMTQIISMPFDAAREEHKQILWDYGVEFGKSYAVIGKITKNNSLYDQMSAIADKIASGSDQPPELFICDYTRLSKILEDPRFREPKLSFLRTTPMLVVCRQPNIDALLEDIKGKTSPENQTEIIGIMDQNQQTEQNYWRKLLNAFYAAKADNAYDEVTREAFEAKLRGERGTTDPKPGADDPEAKL